MHERVDTLAINITHSEAQKFSSLRTHLANLFKSLFENICNNIIILN